MYKFLVVGHGRFPDGLVSSFEMLTGTKNIILKQQLDENKKYEDFENELLLMIKSHNKWIIFADLTGGSPMQCAIKGCMQMKNDNYIVISGVNLAILIDIYFKIGQNDFEIDIVKNIIEESVQQSKDTIQIIDNNFLKEN